MPYVLVCDDYHFATQTLNAAITGMSGTVWPIGSTVSSVTGIRCLGTAQIIDVNSLEQIAHPPMDSEDFQILAEWTVLILVTAFCIRTVARLIERWH